jgi:endonuclease-3
MNQRKGIYELLNDVYGDKEAWTEVNEVLRAENFEDSADYTDPFVNLIIGILSQNVNDRNSTKAYIGLARKFDITPDVLAEADVEEIRNAIKPGGLYNIKSKRIKDFSRKVMEVYDGDLSKALSLPAEEAKRALMALPGIGTKTADVCLAVCAKQEVVAVDTNVDRVAKRLGLVDKDAGYEEVKEALEKKIPPVNRGRTHELLVRLGRDYCKPIKPSCESCPLRSLCKKKL